MMGKKNLDKQKLLGIAQTYYIFKGDFNSEILYDFLLSHNYTFKSDITKNMIGRWLSRSIHFEKYKKAGVNYYKYKEE